MAASEAADQQRRRDLMGEATKGWNPNPPSFDKNKVAADVGAALDKLDAGKEGR